MMLDSSAENEMSHFTEDGTHEMLCLMITGHSEKYQVASTSKSLLT